MWTLIDNNVLRPLCHKNYDLTLNQLSELIEQNTSHKFDELKWLKTEFQFLEAIGQTNFKFHQPKVSRKLYKRYKLKKMANDSYYKEVGDLRVNLFERYRKKLKSVQKLKYGNLKAKFYNQQGFNNEEGKHFFNFLFGHFLVDKTPYYSIIEKLAIDRLYSHNYNQSGVEDFLLDNTLDIFRGISEGHESSQARAVFSLWNDFKLLLREKAKAGTNIHGMSEESLDRTLRYIDNRINLKESNDFLDTDIVHFATFGKVEQGKRVPVLCLTCDNPRFLRERIKIFKWLSRSLLEMTNGQFDIDLNDANGEIICLFQNNYQIKEVIKVSEINDDEPIG